MARQLATPAVSRRTFVAAANGAVRATAAKGAARPVVARQQVRGVKTIDFAGVKEDVYGKLLLSLNWQSCNPRVLAEAREV